MMGQQHALTGVITGVVIATTLKYTSDASLIIQGLVVLITGGASLLPDLDHPSATAARSLGFVTKALARLIDRISLSVYHGTRTDSDVKDRKSGHRLLTHTVPGFLGFAGLSALACLSPISAGVIVGLLSGLLSLGLKLSFGLPLFVIGATCGWYVLSYDSGWWWLVPLCVFLGTFIHTLGDTITNSGTPITYPLTIKGRRWGLTTTPVTFAAGSATELVTVRLVLIMTLIVAVAGYLGILTFLIGRIVS